MGKLPQRHAQGEVVSSRYNNSHYEVEAQHRFHQAVILDKVCFWDRHYLWLNAFFSRNAGKLFGEREQIMTANQERVRNVSLLV